MRLVMRPDGSMAVEDGVELGEKFDWEEWKHPRGHGGKFAKKALGSLAVGAKFHVSGTPGSHEITARTGTHIWVKAPDGSHKIMQPDTLVSPHLKSPSYEPGHTAPAPYVPPPPPPPPAPVGGHDGEPSLTFKKSAGGSNGAYFAEDAKGGQWIVKTYRGNEDRVATEVLSNRIYAALGIPVADSRIVHDAKGRAVLAAPLIEGSTRSITTPSAELGRGFMTDALVGNWDVVGLTDDNILWAPDGKGYRIDQGGTFQYRAQGQTKPYGPEPTEVWSMLGVKKDGRPTQAQRGMFVTDQMKREQAKKIGETLTDDRIDKLIDEAPFADETMRLEVRQALKARVAWMRRFAKGEEKIPRPPEGPEAVKALDEHAPEVYPHELAALKELHTSFEAFNAYVRTHPKGDMQESPELSEKAKAIDDLMREVRTKTAVLAYRSVPSEVGGPADLVGKVLTDQGYAVLTTDAAKAKAPGAMLMRVELPAGTHALHLHAADPSYDVGDVLLRRGSRFRVIGVNARADGTFIVDAVIAPDNSASYAPVKQAKAPPWDDKTTQADW